MRNAKPCGCSFSQSDSCMAGERIRVNSASSCGCERNHYRCQESRNPRPCTPPTCPSKPCPPKPCPKPRPDCEDRCVNQYRRCLKDCRCDRQNRCDDSRHNYECCDDFDSLYGPIYDFDFDFDYDNCGCNRNRRCNRHHDHDHDDKDCRDEK